jgi:hypothetical protein
LFKILWIAATIVSIYLGARSVFVFITIKKHKKHYFFNIAFGALFKLKVIRLCIAMKKNPDETLQIMLVKRKGKTSKIMNLSKMGRFNPDLLKIITPALTFKKIDFEIKIGFHEAKTTCMFCGFLLALLNGLVPVLREYVKMEEVRFRAAPLFKNEKFSVFLFCILKIDFVHIIFRVFKILIKKVVEKHASDREHYASDHE